MDSTVKTQKKCSEPSERPQKASEGLRRPQNPQNGHSGGGCWGTQKPQKSENRVLFQNSAYLIFFFYTILAKIAKMAILARNS